MSDVINLTAVALAFIIGLFLGRWSTIEDFKIYKKFTDDDDRVSADYRDYPPDI